MSRLSRCALATPCLAALLLTAACEHKEFLPATTEPTGAQITATYSREWHQPTDGGIDWKNYPSWADSLGMSYESLRPGKPEGLRVVVYNSDSTRSTLNLAPEGGLAQMRPGQHSLLLYNNDTEYILFNNLRSFASAKATTRTRSRASYLDSREPGTNEHTVTQPDMLYGNYVERFTATRNNATPLTITMHPLVFTYLVRYEFSHGIEYVALARGALAGMAEGVMLGTGHTSKETATVLFDATVHNFGVQATVRSFGTPDRSNPTYTTNGLASKATQRYGLNLEVRLKNGKIKSFDFDVTDQVASQPKGGVIIVKGLEITHEEGKSTGGSAFNVKVVNWGDYQDIDLPL